MSTLAEVLHLSTCAGRPFAHNALVPRCELAADVVASWLASDEAVEVVANRVPLGFTERDPYANAHEAAVHILAALAAHAKGEAT